MKLKFYLAGLLLAGLTLQSCDNDDDDRVKVSNTVQSAFDQRYPNTTVWEWEKDKGLFKAEFRQGGMEAEAWFQADGTWVKTETDYNPALLPQPVTDYVAANYAGYRIDDADWVETPTGSYFELELEKGGSRDVRLLITAEGVLVGQGGSGSGNTGSGTAPGGSGSGNVTVSATLQAAFSAKYPGVTVTEWEMERGLYKAEFWRDGMEAEAWFQADGTWVKTETDYNPALLPQPVTDYVAANYAGYRIDDADWVETPTYNYFDLDLEKGNSLEFHLLITETGVPMN